MKIANATTFEFKCQKCTHPQEASVADSGTIAHCCNCGKPCIVPEPNSDWDEIADEPTSDSSGAFSYDAYKASLLQEDAQLQTLQAEQQLQRELEVPLSQVHDMSAVTTSRTKRFIGSLIDSSLMGIAVVIGMVVFGLLNSVGVMKIDPDNPSALGMINAVCVIYFPLFALAIFQWNMTATEGKTIAKKLLGMKIVTRDGNSPGFARGVAVRYWVVAALAFVPFFSLLNILFIFGESKRCIHDYLAGTYVIDA